MITIGVHYSHERNRIMVKKETKPLRKCRVHCF